MRASVVERDGFVAAEAVAAHLGIRRNTVVAWARSGKIPALKMSKKVLRFQMADVLKALGASEAVHTDEATSMEKYQ